MMTDRDRLAAEIDNHWLYRSDDMVFRCSFGDWEHSPDDTVAEGDRYQPFSAHIADRLIALGWKLGEVKLTSCTSTMGAFDTVYRCNRPAGHAGMHASGGSFWQ